MNLSDLTLRILLLFLPGLLSFIVIDNLTNHKETKLHNILIHSFILGFLCYSAYYIIVLIFRCTFSPNWTFIFFKALANKADLDFKEISFVTLLSIPVGYCITFIINHKFLFRIAQWLKISNKYASVDVLSHLMELDDRTGWVVIRDRANDLMYEGWVGAYSDSTERDEMFLRDVRVYINSTAKLLYETPGLYLPRKREDLLIEFPQLLFRPKDNS